MFMPARSRAICVFAVILVGFNSAQAHNLFVLVKQQSQAPDSIDVIFEHAPRPGKGGYYEPLLARGKTWIVRPNESEETRLKLKEATTTSGAKFLRTETDVMGPRLVLHSCQWGIYEGRLDYFHGKYMDVSSSKEVKVLARASKLPLDIIPHVQDSTLSLQILFEGKPLADKTLWIWSPDGKQATKKTDATGSLELNNLGAGTWSFATTHTIADVKGTFEGKAFKGVMHGTSFSMRWPVKKD